MPQPNAIAFGPLRLHGGPDSRLYLEIHPLRGRGIKPLDRDLFAEVAGIHQNFQLTLYFAIAHRNASGSCVASRFS